MGLVAGLWDRSTHSKNWLATNSAPRTRVATTQILALRRSPRSWSQTAFCMVKLEDTRTRVKIPARTVSRWAPAGGHTEAWARMVKNAANREEKNMTSEPSQMMTPTASMDGLSGRWRWRMVTAGSAARA